MKKHEQDLIKATMKWFHGRFLDCKSEVDLMYACGEYEKKVIKKVAKKVRKLIKSRDNKANV